MSAAAFGARAAGETDGEGSRADAPPAPYTDRLIDGGDLAPMNTAGGESKYDAIGPPRYLKVQAAVSGSSGAGASRSEDGLTISAGVQTQNYGTVTLQGVLRAAPLGGSVALIQRGMPFDGGWSDNNGVGTLNSPQIDLARSQYRFFLPTFPMAGVSTEWLRQGSVQLQAGVGEPGQFDGLQLNGFAPLGGILLTGAAQWSMNSHWSGGLQVVDATGVTTPALTYGLIGLGGAPIIQAPVPRVDAVSTYASLAWRSGSDRDQLNFVQSSGNPGPSALGGWFDGLMYSGRLTQNYGAFWLQPGLTWGYLPISSDSEGIYYRAAYRSQQWLVDGGFDSARSISGTGLSGTMFTGNVRYQIEPTTGLGGTLSYQLSRPDSGEGDVFAEGQDRFGLWRVQVTGSYENQDNLERLSLDQTWKMPVGTRLMTTVFVTGEDIAGQRSAGVGGAISGGGALIGRLSWDGSIGYDSTSGAGSTGDVNANIGVTFRLTDRWSLAATYFDDRNQNSNLFLINPVVPIPLTPVVNRSSAFLLSVRFTADAGSPTAMLGGGAPGMGGGSVSGRLFLDATGDGVLHAGDLGAANVTVLLDGRFSASTDAQGRFEFPLVASGPHEIRVVPDNLPLPWAVADDGRRTVIVHAREGVEVDIAASRIP
jgi:hypothetical protein